MLNQTGCRDVFPPLQDGEDIEDLVRQIERLKSMKVKNNCICAGTTTADSVFYGMPRLYVYDCSKGQRYSAYCPVCGRGGSCADCTSAYLALKKWNKMQTNLRTPLFGGGLNGK